MANRNSFELPKADKPAPTVGSIQITSLNRLLELRKTGLLNQSGREQFGHLTELVRSAIDVPVAIVSIVDEHRQVFAGHCGLPEPWASLGETPITHSFCQQVVETGKELIVLDALNDARVKENPAIVDLGVEAYLGVPIHLPTGELAGALAAIDTSPRQWTLRDLETLRVIAQIVDKEIRLGTSELKYRTLIEDMHEGFYSAVSVRSADGTLVDAVIQEVNPSFERLTGVSASRATGAKISELLPDVSMQIIPVYARALDSSTHETFITKIDVPSERWFETRIRALDKDHLVAFFSDITKRRKAEVEQELLNFEIRHRLKNNLAVVQAIVAQTFRKQVSPELFESFEERLRALATAHDMLFQENWAGAPFGSVVDSALKSLASLGRVILNGPPIKIDPDAVMSLSLIMHELGTNAAKYGALSNEDGQVHVDWSMDMKDGRAFLNMCWRESGGPETIAPSRAGFGSKLVRMGLAGHGDVSMAFNAEGLIVTMSAPLAHLQKTNEQQAR